jgi:hypothetical protein
MYRFLTNEENMFQIQTSELKDFQNWKQLNSKKFFSLYEYTNGVIQVNELSSDICIAFLRLIYPPFVCFNECIFLADEYHQDKLDKLVCQGYKLKELEYWMNLLNLDCYFRTDKEDFSLTKCLFFAHELKKIWMQKLSVDFPTRKFDVSCIQDVDPDTQAEEVYITLYQVE